jgi:hypothetical protein
MKPWFVLPPLLLGCPVSDEPDDTAPEGDVDPDTDADTDTELMVSELSWRLHDEYASLVWVSWTQSAPAEVWVEYGFEGGGWQRSPPVQAVAGSHEQLLLGIPYDERAGWRVVASGAEVVSGETITTGPLPEGLPVPELLVDESEAQLEREYLLASMNQSSGGWTGGDYWTFIINRRGRPVWANPTPRRHWTLFAQVALEGDHILWDEATYWSDYDGGAGSLVHRCYLTGAFEELATPGLHHAFVQLPDGVLAWGSQHHGGGEALVEKQAGQVDESVIWTCSEDWPSAGHCESNGLFYSADRDSYLYSFYTNNSVVEVSRSSGESLWWAGDVSGGYAFDPPQSQFSWQHGISYTDEGTLLVSSHARGEDGSSTTKVIEYEVDHEAALLSEVWSYDPHAYASTNGDAWRLDNGNTLHLLGSASEILEVTPEAEVVWHLDYGATQLLGRGELIEDLYALVPDAGYAEVSR